MIGKLKVAPTCEGTFIVSAYTQEYMFTESHDKYYALLNSIQKTNPSLFKRAFSKAFGDSLVKFDDFFKLESNSFSVVRDDTPARTSVTIIDYQPTDRLNILLATLGADISNILV